MLRQREEERNGPFESVNSEQETTTLPQKSLVKEEMIDVTIPLSKSRKRKSEAKDRDTMVAKKMKVKPSMAIGTPKAPLVKLSVTLKLGPRPVEPEPFPCCLCVSMGKEGLLRVHDPPVNRRDAVEATGNPKSWMAHDQCANIVPETWVDDLDSVDGGKEKVVFGVDGIVKDRWNLVCFFLICYFRDLMRYVNYRRNVLHARKTSQRLMVPLFNVLKANAQRLSMLVALATAMI